MSMSYDPSRDRNTLASYRAGRVEDRAAFVARKLRDMADEIDHRAARREWSGVVHAFVWGIANADIEGLVAAAIDEQKGNGA